MTAHTISRITTLALLTAAATGVNAQSQLFRADPALLAVMATPESSIVLDLHDESWLQTQPESKPSAPDADAHKEENTGQDPTKPLKRLDVRLKYQDLPGGSSAVVPTLRLDIPFPVGDKGWKIGTRFDLPFVISDVPSSDNPGGDWHGGVGDSLAQVLLITPPQGRWQFGFGTQAIFPTGSEDQMGTGKWQLAPMVAGIYALPEISKGSFTGLLVKDQFSIAGDEDRNHVNELVLTPLLNINLPNRWFLTFAPEIKFNLKDDGAAFVPFDILIGKLISPKTVVSVELKAPLLDDYKQYDFEVEFRIGFFF